MSFCVNPNHLINSDAQANGVVSQIFGSLNPIVFEDLRDSSKSKVDAAIDTLLEARYPEGGGGSGLTKGEIAETVLFLIWDDLIAQVDDKNFKLNLEIFESGEGVNLERCYRIETRPLTDDEIGAPDERDPKPPDNPFTPPREINPDRPGRGDEPSPTPRDPAPPATTPPRVPGQPETPTHRQPAPDTPPRETPDSPTRQPVPPLIGGQSPPDKPPSPEDREQNDDGDGDDDDVPINIDIDVEAPDFSGIEAALERIRREIEKQNQLNREHAGNLHNDLLNRLEQIEFDIQTSANIDLSELRKELDEIEQAIKEPIEGELSLSEETLETIKEIFTGIGSLREVVTAIYDHAEATTTAIVENTKEAIARGDQLLGQWETTFGEAVTAFTEEIHSDVNKIINARNLGNEKLREYVDSIIKFEDTDEIQQWICEMIEMFSNIANACNLRSKGS